MFHQFCHIYYKINMLLLPIHYFLLSDYLLNLKIHKDYLFLLVFLIINNILTHLYYYMSISFLGTLDNNYFPFQLRLLSLVLNFHLVNLLQIWQPRFLLFLLSILHFDILFWFHFGNKDEFYILLVNPPFYLFLDHTIYLLFLLKILCP